MTEIDEERWAEIEECFDSIVLDVKNRCYGNRSVGVRYIALLVRRHLRRIDETLLKILAEEYRRAKEQEGGQGDPG